MRLMAEGFGIFTEEGEAIARVHGPDNATLTEVAQLTRVLAAAPQMLDACRTALVNLTPLYSTDHIVIRRLADAIAAAEGRTP